MLIGAYEQFLRIVYFLQLHIFFRKQEKDYWYRKKIAPWKFFTLKPSEIQLDRKKKINEQKEYDWRDALLDGPWAFFTPTEIPLASNKWIDGVGEMS